MGLERITAVQEEEQLKMQRLLEAADEKEKERWLYSTFHVHIS